MSRLVVCYRDGGLEGRVAELLNSAYSALPVAGLYEPLEAGVVAEWFRPPEYEPETFAAVAGESGWLLGLAWAWTAGEEGSAPQGFVRVALDPRAPPGERLHAARALLSWARHSLESWQGVRGVVDLMLGGLGGYDWEAVCSIVRCSLEGLRVRGFVMTAPEGGLNAPRPRGYEVSEARPHESRRDAEAVVEVFNDSFSVYDTFTPWRPERAARYYSRLYSRREALVLVAYSRGEPAGFVEAYLHPTLAGGHAGEVSLLAVKRSHQGRGLGAYLLSEAYKWLRRRGARTVYLDAMHLAAGLYLRLGFRIVYAYHRLRLPLAALPDPGLDGAEPWNPGACRLPRHRPGS